MVITAAHCFSGPPRREPKQIEVWFDYVERPDGTQKGTKSGTQVSHGICPDCTRKLYPAYAQRMEASARGEKP